MDALNDLPKAFQCEAFKKLKEVSSLANLTEKERHEYEDIQRHYWDTLAILDYNLRTGREEGLKEGFEKGEEKGLKKGREEGEKKGKFEAARNFKKLGVAVDIIKQATGLSDEEINAL